MLPPLHATAWAAAAYLLLSGALRGLPPMATLVVGGIVYAAVIVAVLLLVVAAVATRSPQRRVPEATSPVPASPSADR